MTLEPCTHHGRTGPCADALLAAGVTRVVVATADPNPVVHGKGIARLRAAGVEVRSGVLQEPARRLNDGFAKFITTFLPFVTMKVAATLDGRIAPERTLRHCSLLDHRGRSSRRSAPHAPRRGCSDCRGGNDSCR